MESETSSIRTFECVQKTYARVTNHLIRRKKSKTPDQLSHCFINLQFALMKTNHEWIAHDQYYGDILREEQEPLILNTFLVTRQQLMSPASIHEVIKKELMCWPLSDYWREPMIVHGLNRARNRVRSVSCSGSDVYMEISLDFCFEHHHIFPPSYESYDLMSSRLSYGMVPATDSSIESLKSNIIDGSNCDGSCPICVEEFSAGGDKVVSMPCSHEFHLKCIEKWLRTSHYCPTCRYEMPTELDNDDVNER